MSAFVDFVDFGLEIAANCRKFAMIRTGTSLVATNVVHPAVDMHVHLLCWPVENRYTPCVCPGGLCKVAQIPYCGFHIPHRQGLDADLITFSFCLSF